VYHAKFRRSVFYFIFSFLFGNSLTGELLSTSIYYYGMGQNWEGIRRRKKRGLRFDSKVAHIRLLREAFFSPGIGN